MQTAGGHGAGTTMTNVCRPSTPGWRLTCSGWSVPDPPLPHIPDLHPIPGRSPRTVQPCIFEMEAEADRFAGQGSQVALLPGKRLSRLIRANGGAVGGREP